MKDNSNTLFSDEEKDILQEIMNIAFGSATADLSDIIDIYVILSVPDIKIVNIENLPKHIDAIVNNYTSINIVEQKFWGNFQGIGMLIFPENAGNELIYFLDEKDASPYEKNSIHNMEQEILMEIGNILIGACIGKIADLLSTIVTFSPPFILDKEHDTKNIVKSLEADQTAILMKTVFQFEEKDINGFLLIITDNKSISWFKQALYNFLESYE